MEKQKAIILCIDDDVAGLKARKELLEISDYEVLTAQSGEQGLGLFVSRQIDAVVVDYKMPGMNGDRVARQMRRVNLRILHLHSYRAGPGLAGFGALLSSVRMHRFAWFSFCSESLWNIVFY